MRARTLKAEALRSALVHRQRLDVLGELLGGLAHELGNALSVAGGHAELLAEALDSEAPGSGDEDEGRQRQARLVVAWTGQAAQIVHQLLSLSHRLRGRRQRLALNALVAEAVELVRYRCEREKVVLALELCPDDPWVEGWPGPLQQAVVNLLQNSREALSREPAGGTIRVAITAEQGRAAVAVEDDGPGIGPALAGQVFEAGCTTREGEAGAGLGLAVCRWVAREHGGEARLAECETGARLVLELPLVRD
ncbi:MAG: HAMP domain-containing sensor histidine kinase [Gemmatimonadota bacterium]